MKTYSRGYTPMTCMTDRDERYQRLVHQLEASADRICDYQDRLMTSAATMKPIELERLMDAYRAEQIRYDHIDRELQAIETPAKTATAKEKWRTINKDRRRKLNY